MKNIVVLARNAHRIVGFDGINNKVYKDFYYDNNIWKHFVNVY